MTIRKLIWWCVFIAATLSLSKVFEASRAVTQGQTEGHVSLLIFWGIVLLLGVVYLGYESYTNAKRENALVREVWLFETLHRLTQQERS